MMSFISQNFSFLILLLIVLFAILTVVYNFLFMPKSAQIEAIKEWLKWAVADAENYLGSGTGQLKLRYVYSRALEQFPYIERIIDFEMFSILVDDALVWLKNQLEQNKQIEGFCNGV